MNQFAGKFFIAAFAVLLAPAAHAAGLGGIDVRSSLGQALVAEVEIIALKPKEFEELQARIANVEEYKAANLVYASVVRQIRVSAARRAGGKAVLQLTSIAPINEPSLDLLVELTWPGGRLLQKYTLLLDPQK